MSDKASLAIGRLERVLRGITSRSPIVQAIIAVEDRGRSFRWIGTEGTTTSGDRVTEHTPFFVASIDKLYNATVVLMLAEAGKLDIDEPIKAYLPSVITRGLHRYRGRDVSDRITVRHLLTHTSGLADWLEDYPKTGPSLIEVILKEGDRLLTIEELVAHVRDQLKPHFPPQDLHERHVKARYSDTNFMLIIAIVEAVTGQPLHEVHARMLHEPLGLRQTYFPAVSRLTDSAMDSMVLHARGRPLDIPLLIESVRGIYSSVGDMMLFLRRLMEGSIFHSPDTLTAMQRSWYRFGLPLDRAAFRSPSWPIEYGLGIMRFRLPRVFTPAVPMPSVLGHTGSTGCWLFFCPQMNVMVAGSVNEVTAGAVPFRAVPKILKILRQTNVEP